MVIPAWDRNPRTGRLRIEGREEKVEYPPASELTWQPLQWLWLEAPFFLVCASLGC